MSLEQGLTGWPRSELMESPNSARLGAKRACAVMFASVTFGCERKIVNPLMRFCVSASDRQDSPTACAPKALRATEVNKERNFIVSWTKV